MNTCPINSDFSGSLSHTLAEDYNKPCHNDNNGDDSDDDSHDNDDDDSEDDD